MLDACAELNSWPAPRITAGLADLPGKSDRATPDENRPLQRRDLPKLHSSVSQRPTRVWLGTTRGGDIKRTVFVYVMVVALGGLMPVGASAQQPPAPAAEGEGAELAKKLANPISDLVSVPFQFNWEQGVGPNNQTRFILNVQPVMPFSLNADWNLITRVIMPFVSQPPLDHGGTTAFGISDLTTSFFFSPTSVGKFDPSEWDRSSRCHRRRSRRSALKNGRSARPSSS